jgi:hypothetical protein
MLTKSFKSGLILLLALNILACSFILPISAPKPSAADIEKEEQAVYAFFISGIKGTAVILQNTSVGMSSSDPNETIDFIRSGLKGISKETANSYLERNAQPSQLSPDMNLGADYVLLSDDELAAITSQSNWGEVLNEKYPGSQGYTMFSRVGFNNSLDQAVIYVGNLAGPLMGAGYYYLMVKENGEWIMKEQVMAWIS